MVLSQGEIYFDYEVILLLQEFILIFLQFSL